jgi:hypothetical protein
MRRFAIDCLVAVPAVFAASAFLILAIDAPLIWSLWKSRAQN